MSWRDEYREGLSEVAAALNRIADEQRIANRLALHAAKISMADAQRIFHGVKVETTAWEEWNPYKEQPPDEDPLVGARP